jgi:hypothetical protein
MPGEPICKAALPVPVNLCLSLPGISISSERTLTISHCLFRYHSVSFTESLRISLSSAIWVGSSKWVSIEGSGHVFKCVSTGLEKDASMLPQCVHTKRHWPVAGPDVSPALAHAFPPNRQQLAAWLWVFSYMNYKCRWAPVTHNCKPSY